MVAAPYTCAGDELPRRPAPALGRGHGSHLEQMLAFRQNASKCCVNAALFELQDPTTGSKPCSRKEFFRLRDLTWLQNRLEATSPSFLDHLLPLPGARNIWLTHYRAAAVEPCTKPRSSKSSKSAAAANQRSSPAKSRGQIACAHWRSHLCRRDSGSHRPRTGSISPATARGANVQTRQPRFDQTGLQMPKLSASEPSRPGGRHVGIASRPGPARDGDEPPIKTATRPRGDVLAGAAIQPSRSPRMKPVNTIGAAFLALIVAQLALSPAAADTSCAMGRRN